MIMMMMYRWAPDQAMDKQPGYLRFVLNFILDTFEEFKRQLGPEGRSYSVNATIEEVTNQIILSKYTTLYINQGNIHGFDFFF